MLLLRISLSILTAIFPTGPELASTRVSPLWILLEVRAMEVVETTGAMQSSSQIVTTNKPRENLLIKVTMRQKCYVALRKVMC